MSYFINGNCLCCHNCALECPVGAIDYVGTRYAIDQDKCVNCGHCQAVCNVSAVESTEKEPVKEHGPVRLEADIVVLGAGGSGTVAAVRAAELTGKKVIVLEKMKKPGGSGWFAGFDISLGQRKGPGPGNYTEGIDPELVKNIKAAPAEFADWFLKFDGVKENFVPQEDHGAVRYGLPTGKRYKFNTRCMDEAIGPGKGGSFVVYTMLCQFERLGIQLLTEHRAVKILTDGSGAVCGVIARDPGGETRIDCRAVIVSTGGFARNDELLKKTWPWFFTGDKTAEPVHRFAAPGNTGDVVGLGESAGAYVDWDNFFVNLFGPVHHPFSFALFSLALEPAGINVNLNGRRYFDESFFGNGAGPILEQPGRVGFCIMDSATLEETMAGLINSPRGMYFEDYKEEIEHELTLHPALYRADTIEELAEQAGINAPNLRETVERYNGYCRAGEDGEFGRRPDTLHPIEKGPFYAIYGKTATDGAFGGILINGRMEAYNAGKTGVVPGLYATGDNASGWAKNPGGPGPDRKMLINEMCWAVYSGFIAGKNAAEYLSK